MRVCVPPAGQIGEGVGTASGHIGEIGGAAYLRQQVFYKVRMHCLAAAYLAGVMLVAGPIPLQYVTFLLSCIS